MEADPDVKLMLKFQQGDRSAFDALFEKYKKPLVNFTYRFSGNKMIAEELTQETFLRVYKAAKNYSPTAKFSTWLFRIATNLCLNERRRIENRFWTDGYDKEYHAGQPEANYNAVKPPHKLAEQREKHFLIQKAVLALPDKQRAALLLLIQNGFSYKEIGSQMNLSEKAVKSLIFRARQNLKQKLKSRL